MINDSWKVYTQLLSEEGIDLKYSATADTAWFDIKNRVVTIPTFEFMTENVTQMLISHEVGHARYTRYSLEEFHSLTKKYGDLFNVCEDAYIERRIQTEFPGLKEIFKSGYSTLCDVDFFRLKDENIADFSLVSRLNLYAKCGMIYDIPFVGKENEFALRIKMLKSSDEVLELCEDIYQYIKENKQKNDKKINISSDMKIQKAQEQESDGDDVEIPRLNPDKSTASEYDEESDYNVDSDNSDNQDEETDITANEFTSGSSSNDDIDEDLVDNIQKNFEKNLKDYGMSKVSDDTNDDRTFVINSKKITDVAFVDLSMFASDLNRRFKEVNNATNKKNEKMIITLAKHADMIFKQRQTAWENRNATNMRVGKIDNRRISHYKISENIFRSVRQLPEGKNHGVVILLDFSGSMEESRANVIFQAAVFGEFCRINDIPFEILGFGVYVQYQNNITFQDTIKICDSTNFSIGALLMYTKNHMIISDDYKILSNCTPTVDGLVIASNTIAKYKQYGIEKTSLFLITDGVHDSDNYTGEFCEDQIHHERKLITKIRRIVYDNVLYDIDSYIPADQNIHSDYIIELLCARLKKLYGTYISVMFLNSYAYLCKSCGSIVQRKFNPEYPYNHDSIYSADEYFYIYKHGYYFEKPEDINNKMSGNIVFYDFKNNPFIDQFFAIDFGRKARNAKAAIMDSVKIADTGDDYESYMNQLFKNFNTLKLLVTNYITKIA